VADDIRDTIALKNEMEKIPTVEEATYRLDANRYPVRSKML
jgi:hypothetical protein